MYVLQPYQIKEITEVQALYAKYDWADETNMKDLGSWPENFYPVRLSTFDMCAEMITIISSGMENHNQPYLKIVN